MKYILISSEDYKSGYSVANSFNHSTLKFKEDEKKKKLEYHKYSKKRVKKDERSSNGFVNVIFKTDYDKKIILTM